MPLFTVRSSRGDEGTKSVTFRFPNSALKDVDDEAAQLGATRTGVIVEACRVRREMSKALAPLKQQIARFAIDNNLEWPGGEVEAIRRLVERGLEEQERSRRR